ncbi:MAG: hypothetical protein QM831_37770 [Kofleriaceae bacterium]
MARTTEDIDDIGEDGVARGSPGVEREPERPLDIARATRLVDRFDHRSRK